METLQLRKMKSHRDVKQKAGDGSLQVGGDLREVAERSVLLALFYASPIFMLEIAWLFADRRLNAHFKK